jgi:hypothetical protein
MSTRTPGDRVTHTQYGDGTVRSANEYHTIIDFDAHGERTFSSPRVVLGSSSTCARRPFGRRRRNAPLPSRPRRA